MSNYVVVPGPLGEPVWKCEHTPESILLVKKYIEENYHEDYTLCIVDQLTNETLEITNPICKIIDNITDIISFISSTEHTFVDWVGLNRLSDSYVVGMEFTRGEINIPSTCKYKNGKLISIQ
ncbi:MAG: hypothetical protein K2N29_03475 [Ruminiclostridium sp.]|nr:hypothetical protein [Ruminiclostridium sp.]